MTRSRPRAAILLLLFATGAWWAQTPAPAEQAALSAVVESTRTAFYPGQDLTVKLIFKGAGEDEVVIDARAFDREAFALVDSGGKRPGRVSEPPAPADSGPITLRGFDTAERVVNLSAWYPKLTAKTGNWELSWSYGKLKAGPIRICVVRQYRPDKDTTAVVETELGRMTWELMPDVAPEHVKQFVDLVRTGFYDGLTIFKVVPGLEAVGGDPKGDGTGGWTRLLRPEINGSLKMGTGLIGASRRETSMTSDSVFFITLGPSDYMQGKQTFYGRLTDGFDVIAKLHPLPNRGETGFRDAWTLITPVKINRITIR